MREWLNCRRAPRASANAGDNPMSPEAKVVCTASEIQARSWADRATPTTEETAEGTSGNETMPAWTASSRSWAQ